LTTSTIDVIFPPVRSSSLSNPIITPVFPCASPNSNISWIISFTQTLISSGKSASGFSRASITNLTRASVPAALGVSTGMAYPYLSSISLITSTIEVIFPFVRSSSLSNPLMTPVFPCLSPKRKISSIISFTQSLISSGNLENGFSRASITNFTRASVPAD